METCPPEILQEIFALACTDAGHTGRSLSLVSRYIHDISSPYKYQSLAITQCRQIITFSQTFSQLPEFQKKIKYLLVHCPCPPMNVEGSPRCGDSSSIGSEEGKELSEGAGYRRVVTGNGLQAPGGNICDDVQGESEIQALFDDILEAFRAILNESSSTLTILGVYWTSFEPLQIHRLLPPLPLLQELHLYRCSITPGVGYEEPPPTGAAFFPRLLFLSISGDYPLGRISFKDDLARIAPNLTHIRISPHYLVAGSKSQRSTQSRSAHPFNLHLGGVIVENLYGTWSLGLLKCLINSQFGTSVQIALEDFEEKPKVWQRWWASRVAGEVGPWGSIASSNSNI